MTPPRNVSLTEAKLKSRARPHEPAAPSVRAPGLTRPRAETELTGLVYGLTEKPHDAVAHWYERPIVLAGVVLGLTVVLNLIFF